MAKEHAVSAHASNVRARKATTATAAAAAEQQMTCDPFRRRPSVSTGEDEEVQAGRGQALPDPTARHVQEGARGGEDGMCTAIRSRRCAAAAECLPFR